jgi:hypothetical protein
MREQAGRNASERRAGLEMRDVGADPPQKRGRPPSLGNWGAYPREATRTSGPTGVVAMACLHTEIRRNTGNPRRWGRVTLNRRPARAGPGHLGWRTGP